MDEIFWDVILNNFTEGLPCTVVFLVSGAYALRTVVPLLQRILEIQEKRFNMKQNSEGD